VEQDDNEIIKIAKEILEESRGFESKGKESK